MEDAISVNCVRHGMDAHPTNARRLKKISYFFQKPLDTIGTKCYTIIVKEMRLQVDSPMLAKGSNPVMDASKNLLEKF